MSLHPILRSLFNLVIVLSLILTVPTTLTVTAASSPADSCEPIMGFRRTNFTNSNKVTNNFLPLVPGTQLTLKGFANRGGGALNHQVVFTVTDLVKEIDGVKTVVVLDTDTNESELVESELSFFAQDIYGNVWNLGEYPEEYENGSFVGAPSTWISGEIDAKGGIHMMAQPTIGTPGYLQGIVPSIEFHDCAKVVSKGQKVCISGKCYTNVLTTDEWSPLEPGAVQQKFHAPGVGIIKVGAVNDPEGETLVLTNKRKLGSQALTNARKAALKLEQRAYQVSDVYKETKPAEKASQ